jgi:hypothetical protein
MEVRSQILYIIFLRLGFYWKIILCFSFFTDTIISMCYVNIPHIWTRKKKVCLPNRTAEMSGSAT